MSFCVNVSGLPQEYYNDDAYNFAIKHKFLRKDLGCDVTE